MNYDSELSSEVSLSRILDEMLADGTPFDVVMAFLKGHESAIPDIYRNSALVFDLYDIAVHPERAEEQFLVDNMHHLPKTDLYFALSMRAVADPAFARKYRESGLPGADIVRDIHRSSGRLGRAGMPMDDAVLADFQDFDACLAIVFKDERDVSSFLVNSYLARSALMAESFLRLPAGPQYMLLTKLVSKGETAGRYELSQMYADLLVSLMRQLLAFNQVELFNWVASVFESRYGRLGYSFWDRAVVDAFLCRIPNGVRELLMSSGNESAGRVGFAEVVFEMNLVETQFDPIDLFLAVYAMGKCNYNGLKKTLDEMAESADLLEFFNLPFDWKSLEKFADKEAK